MPHSGVFPLGDGNFIHYNNPVNLPWAVLNGLVGRHEVSVYMHGIIVYWRQHPLFVFCLSRRIARAHIEFS